MSPVSVSVRSPELEDADVVSHKSARVEVHRVWQPLLHHGFARLDVVQPGPVSRGEPGNYVIVALFVSRVGAPRDPDVGGVPANRALTQGRVLQIETGPECPILKADMVKS